jgi:hypothetical protein
MWELRNVDVFTISQKMKKIIDYSLFENLIFGSCICYFAATSTSGKQHLQRQRQWE